MGESCNFGEYCDSGNPCVLFWWIWCSSEPGNFGEYGSFVDSFDSGESEDFDEYSDSGITYQYMVNLAIVFTLGILVSGDFCESCDFGGIWQFLWVCRFL